MPRKADFRPAWLARALSAAAGFRAQALGMRCGLDAPVSALAGPVQALHTV